MWTLCLRVPSGIRPRPCSPFAAALSSPHAGSRNPGFCNRIQTNALTPDSRSTSRMRSRCTSGDARGSARKGGRCRVPITCSKGSAASARRFRTCALINSICDVRLPESFLVCSLGLLPPVKHCRKEIFLHGQIFRAADSAARTCGHTCPKLQNKTAKTIVLVFVGGFTKLLMLRNPRLQDPKTAALEIFMPALTSLPELLSKNPDQAKSLNRNERQARERATRVHLIHVTGPKEVPFDELLTE